MKNSKDEEILSRMLKVLMRAQRKVDDKNYRETLKRIEKI